MRSDDPPFRSEILVHAVGEVIEDGTTGPSSQLRCNLPLDRDGSIKKSEVVFR